MGPVCGALNGGGSAHATETEAAVAAAGEVSSRRGDGGGKEACRKSCRCQIYIYLKNWPQWG